MKSNFIYTLVLLFVSIFMFTNQVNAQEEGDVTPSDFDIVSSYLSAGEKPGVGANFNYSRIGDQNFIGFRIKPDLSFGKLGFGLDVPLMFNLANGKLRTDEFKGGIGVLRTIRYVRYGVKKKDDIFLRMGNLSDAYIGFGALLNNYNNSISFEKSKLGLEFDMTFKDKFGIEFLYSDIDLRSFNLMALRPYYKPLGATAIPILKTFEIGVTGIYDHDNTTLDTMQAKTNVFVNKGVSAFGFDAGFYVFRLKWLQLKFYAQYAHLSKINNDMLDAYMTSPAFLVNFPKADTAFVKNYKAGGGASIGSEFSFKFLGNLLKMNYKAERIWYDDYYMPQFFDAAYEINKDYKISTLLQSKQKAGIYIDAKISVLDKIVVNGGLMLPDKVSVEAPAMVKVGMDLSNLHEKLILYANYYRGNISSLSDAIKFDDRSLMNMRAAWKVYEVEKFNLKVEFIAGVDYRWTFMTKADDTFEAASYVSPYFSLTIPLMGAKSSEPVEEE